MIGLKIEGGFRALCGTSAARTPVPRKIRHITRRGETNDAEFIEITPLLVFEIEAPTLCKSGKGWGTRKIKGNGKFKIESDIQIAASRFASCGDAHAEEITRRLFQGDVAGIGLDFDAGFAVAQTSAKLVLQGGAFHGNGNVGFNVAGVGVRIEAQAGIG